MSYFLYDCDQMKKDTLFHINKIHPQKKIIQKAAEVLKKGGLVAFPTETVYGLGANAMDIHAVRKIFKAKGRPSDNPLIVHIADTKELGLVARDIPSVARKLMKAFWPGPLTLVLKKKKTVPSLVTAGGKTVAVRIPKHPVALALIKAAGCPIAAPSANIAGKPSPTDARHVAADFGSIIDMILDGGKTFIGLESTVVDATRTKVSILRSGCITAKMLEKVLGYKPKFVTRVTKKVRSPGLKYRHYAPDVDMVLVTELDPKNLIAKVEHKIFEFHRDGLLVGVLACKEHRKYYQTAEQVIICGSLKNLTSVARNLFASLRAFNREKVDVIIAENFGTVGIGHAIMDRLKRAASKID